MEKFNGQIGQNNESPKNVELKVAVGATAAGLGVPAGVATTVAALGSASTGTAISALSGAAATNATIAAIGGGSLAAGGGGMLLGASILTGGGILVALGVGYGIWRALSRNQNSIIDYYEKEEPKLLNSRNRNKRSSIRYIKRYDL